MHGACTALRDAAAVLGADEPKVVAQNPKKRRGIVNVIDDVLFTVNGEAHRFEW
jgi:hypothetical protein